MPGTVCFVRRQQNIVTVSKLRLFSLFSVRCLHSDPSALNYINITTEENIYVYMDGNKINIINLRLSVCCLVSEDADTGGRS